MKTKRLLAIGTFAALASGLVAIGACAQDQESDCGRATSEIVRQAVRQQVQQAVLQARVQAHAQLARAISENVSSSITNAVNTTVTNAVMNEVTARVNSRIQAALANSLAWQDGAGIFAQQTPPATPRAIIGDEEFSLLEETGWLGVTPEEVSADRAKELKLASARGVYVSEVEKESPAEKAGLKSGDVITEFNGEHVEGVAQFRRLVRETPSGRTISIAVWRDGRAQTLSVTLGDYEDQFQNQYGSTMRELRPRLNLTIPDQQMITPWPPEAHAFEYSIPEGNFNFNGDSNIFRMSPTPMLGISAESVSGQLGTYFGAPDGEGVLVREVNSGSPAEKAGMKAGDVIVKVEGDRVRTLNEMQSKLREKREAKTVQVTVMRRGAETTLTVEPNKPPAHSAAPRVSTRPVSM